MPFIVPFSYYEILISWYLLFDKDFSKIFLNVIVFPFVILIPSDQKFSGLLMEFSKVLLVFSPLEQSFLHNSHHLSIPLAVNLVSIYSLSPEVIIIEENSFWLKVFRSLKFLLEHQNRKKQFLKETWVSNQAETL